MTIKKNIQRILITACWILIGSGVLVLLVAAVNIKNQKTCKDIDIDISGVKDLYFLDKEDVLRIVTEGSMQTSGVKTFRSFDLQRLEKRLEENIYVKDAELFFDNNLVLHVTIEEREPVARIFTTGNQSFYIDRTGARLPLREKMIVKLPVFTGFPEDPRSGETADSAMLSRIAGISEYILNNEFWMAQIAQVDIVAGNALEMVPTLGNHIIQFGDASGYEDKFSRLFLFYKQVLSKAGLDKYSRINVSFAKQVIGTRKEGMPKIDSIQALKNIRKLIDASTWKPVDSTEITGERNMEPHVSEGMLLLQPGDTMETVKREDAIKVKRPVIANKKKVIIRVPDRTPAKAAPKKVPASKQPKAVMKKN